MGSKSVPSPHVIVPLLNLCIYVDGAKTNIFNELSIKAYTTLRMILLGDVEVKLI